MTTTVYVLTGHCTDPDQVREYSSDDGELSSVHGVYIDLTAARAALMAIATKEIDELKDDGFDDVEIRDILGYSEDLRVGDVLGCQVDVFMGGCTYSRYVLTAQELT